MKTEASRKPVPLESDLTEVLVNWREECALNQPEDYVFASIEKKGKQPLWPNSMEKVIKPAAKRVGIVKQIGWHTLRHYAESQNMPNPLAVARSRAHLRFLDSA